MKKALPSPSLLPSHSGRVGGVLAASTSVQRASFHITAINPLTRQREPITPPISRQVAEELIDRLKAIPSRKRTFIYCRMEVIPPFSLN